jgi:pilus assembly protein TadC
MNSLSDRRRGMLGHSVMAIALFAGALIVLLVVALIISAAQRQLRSAPRAVPFFDRETRVLRSAGESIRSELRVAIWR